MAKDGVEVTEFRRVLLRTHRLATLAEKGRKLPLKSPLKAVLVGKAAEFTNTFNQTRDWTGWAGHW
jgi:hypothetical protein